MTTIINPRRINRTIVVERDSRTLTARVIDALDAPNGIADMLAEAQQARDDAQTAQGLSESARDDSSDARDAAVQAAQDADASEINAASSEGIASAAASTAVSARDTAVDARNAAQAWAESPTPPGGAGTESAKTAAGKARADALLTAADRVQTGLDKTQTGADRVATGLDRVQTGLDSVATAADRVQTGLDRVATDADKTQTGLDRVATGLDKVATAADRVQTGLDKTDAVNAKEAAETAATLANGMPLGTITYFAADTPPGGWLVCDGTAVTALYPDLRSFLLDAGSPYGVSGADPLLPDLRGEFVRGWDGGRGVDAGRVFGSAQGDAIRNITGKFDAGGRTGPKSAADFEGAFSKVESPATSSNGNASNDSRAIDFDASRVVPTADENRPRNIALLPCIRAYASVVNIPGQAEMDSILQQTQVQVDDALDRVVGEATDAAVDKVVWKRVGKVPVGTGAAVTLTGLDMTKETLIVLGYVRCSVTSAQTLRIRSSEDGGSNWGASLVVASSTSNWSASYLWGEVRMFPDPDNSEVVTSILTGPTTAAAYTYVSPPLYSGAFHQAINALQFSWSSGNFQATGLGGNADHIIIYQRG